MQSIRAPPGRGGYPKEVPFFGRRRVQFFFAVGNSNCKFEDYAKNRNQKHLPRASVAKKDVSPKRCFFFVFCSLLTFQNQLKKRIFFLVFPTPPITQGNFRPDRRRRRRWNGRPGNVRDDKMPMSMPTFFFWERDLQKRGKSDGKILRDFCRIVLGWVWIWRHSKIWGSAFVVPWKWFILKHLLKRDKGSVRKTGKKKDDLATLSTLSDIFKNTSNLLFFVGCCKIIPGWQRDML